MIENPWCHLPESPPFVLPDDAAAVNAFNSICQNDSHKYYLHVEARLPEPFVGDINAPVLLLSNNPGYDKKNDSKCKEGAVFKGLMRNNLQTLTSDYPFIYLAPDIDDDDHPKKWWLTKLKSIVNEFGPQAVSRSILNVVYTPYSSKNFGSDKLALPSQKYSIHLLREAIKRNAVIVYMRSRLPKLWGRVIPELKGYTRSFMVSHTRKPTLNPGKWDGYKEVVDAIRVAESNRLR